MSPACLDQERERAMGSLLGSQGEQKANFLPTKVTPTLPFAFGLDLYGTQVTDAGLKDLKELKNLTLLNLGFTQVTDAGLKDLKELKNLTSLNLQDTKVTDKGVDE